MSTNTSEVELIPAGNNCWLDVSLTVEERQNKPPFIHASIEWMNEDGETIETYSVADAERIADAFTEAVRAAKAAVVQAIKDWYDE